MKNIDMVNHPSHYKSNYGIEVIDVIEAFTEDLKGVEAVSTANVIKYICRWKKKNGLEDLKKAQWYLDHLIDHIEYGDMNEYIDIKIDSMYNNATCPYCGSEDAILKGVRMEDDGTITGLYDMCSKCGLDLDGDLLKL